MKDFLTNKLNGWWYFGILTLSFIFINTFLQLATKNQDDIGLQIIFYVLSFIFLIVCLFFAYHRCNRVYGVVKLGFYIFAYSFLHINIFGNSMDYVSSYEQLQIFKQTQSTLYTFTSFSPFLQIYAAIYNIGLIFRNSKNVKKTLI